MSYILNVRHGIDSIADAEEDDRIDGDGDSVFGEDLSVERFLSQ